jgi:hypothetical protein
MAGAEDPELVANGQTYTWVSSQDGASRNRAP